MHASSRHIDFALLDELRIIMDSEFNLLIETYLEDSTMRLDDLEKAFQLGDLDTIRGIAHSFKGSSSNVGALILAKLCQDLEITSQKGLLTQAEPYFKSIQDEYMEVKTIIADEVLH